MNDQKGTPRTTLPKTGASNEYDVEMEKLRLEAAHKIREIELANTCETNQFDVSIAGLKAEEEKLLMNLRHEIEVSKLRYNDGAHLRNSIVTVIQWTLACSTIAAIQIVKMIADGKVAQREAELGTSRR